MPVEAPKKTSEKPAVFRAVGRRKTAVARARVFNGEGMIVVNDKPITEYFSGPVARLRYEKPFEVTNTRGKLSASVKVVGSGKTGQLDALVQGISRALALMSEDYHGKLRNAGLLTRDSRAKERRKYGLAGKARKRKQSPKR